MTVETLPAKCRGTNRQGNPCGLAPIPGGFVCKWHGGGAPQVKAAAERRLAARQLEQSAEAVLAHEGVLAVEDPLQELGKLASSAKALMEALGQRVNALEQIETFDEKRAPHVRVAVELYERAMDRTHRLLNSLITHGYTERQVAIAEQEAMLVAGVIRRVVAGLGLSKDQQDRAQELLAAEFRALEEAARA